MSLSLRTINAPGVEMTEVDRSQYSQTLTGTKVLVVGYADKGEDYATTNPTSKSTLVNIYGKPTNEAERYFYEGCKEVISQGGTLFAAKIPYANNMAGQYVAIDYTVNQEPISKNITVKNTDAVYFEELLSKSNSDDNELTDTYLTSTANITDEGNSVYASIHDMDPSISNIYEIKCAESASLLSGDEYDEFITGEKKVSTNTIKIVDITRGTYGKTAFKDGEYYKECIGIVPVITTAANAMFTQMLLSGNTKAENFNILSGINTLNIAGTDAASVYENMTTFSITSNDIAIPFGGTGTVNNSYQEALADSITTRANTYFPAIVIDKTNDDNTVTFDREYFKQIGIVVFKAFIDPAYNNKINFNAVEAFVGSLDPKGTNIATGANIFIENIVNSQSEYIRVFSNVTSNENVDMYYVGNQPAASLGFYEAMTIKNITFGSITNALNKIFDHNSDINEKEIDIVMDGGITTIAGFSNESSKLYDPTDNITISSAKKNWRAMASKFDDFCKNMRKDCIFVCDGMRQFCLKGKKRIVRPSKPTNTIDTSIIPNLLEMPVLNSNYSAGYCDWFEVVDEFSGDTFWCPPSIKATGVYIYTDKHANYWDAPAGLNRGMVSANDVAFNPNIVQAGPIYTKNWNYAINYPDEGVVLEGQKTMQVKQSCFDRINVRRLFLRLERFVFKVCRYFVYEPNTQYTRDRLVDQLSPYFSQVRSAGGIYDFKIICDESINTPEVIDNNELRLRIGVKPTKTAEFIIVEFVALKTGGNWSELTNI